MNYSNIQNNNCRRKSGLRQPVPEAHSPKNLAQMETAAEGEAYGAVHMTANNRVQCQISISDAGTEAATWSIADTDRIVNQLQREMYGITSKDQMRFMKDFSIRLVEFESWWQAIGVQELRKTIEQHVLHFGHPKMHLVSHISESIWRMDSGDNFTTDISERLHIRNVKEVYRSTNNVNYIQQMLKHNDHCTSLDYTEETLL